MTPFFFAAVVRLCVLRRKRRTEAIGKSFEVSSENLSALKNHGFVVIDNAISPCLLESCAVEAKALRSDMKPGKISRGLTLAEGQNSNNVIRSDKMLWLKNEWSSRTSSLYLLQQKFENLRNKLNDLLLRSFETSVDKCSFMLAVYPGAGKGYKRHKDSEGETKVCGRKLTAILYLNNSWEQRFGGCLRIWPEERTSNGHVTNSKYEENNNVDICNSLDVEPIGRGL